MESSAEMIFRLETLSVDHSHVQIIGFRRQFLKAHAEKVVFELWVDGEDNAERQARARGFVSSLGARALASGGTGIVRAHRMLNVGGHLLAFTKREVIIAFDDEEELAARAQEGWNASEAMFQVFPASLRVPGIKDPHSDLDLDVLRLAAGSPFVISCGADGEMIQIICMSAPEANVRDLLLATASDLGAKLETDS